MATTEGLSPHDVRRDGSPELWQRVRSRIIEPGGLYFFVHGLLGFPDLTRRCHLALCLFLEDRSRASKLVEYPRRHLKTTIVTIGYTLWLFACRIVRGEDPIDRVAIGSSTKTNAMRMLRLIKIIPEQNVLFQNFFPELMPEFSNEEVWNQEEIIFPRRRSFPDPSVDTLGAGGKPASRHYTTIIEDDMINEENWDSESAVRKAIELHKLWENLLEGSPGDERITNENSWNDYDLNHHIVEHERETAVLSVGATGFITPRSRHLPPKVVELFDELSDGESIWPERFDRQKLLEIRAKVGARIYNAQYENQPFDPDVVDFKEEWLNYYELVRDRKTGSYYARVLPRSRPDGREIEMERVYLRTMHVVAAFDPALSKKTDAARSALVVTGVDPIGRVFILDIFAVRDDPLKTLDRVFEKVHEWDVQRCAIEDVVFQKVLIDLLEERCRFWNRDHPSERLYPATFEGIKPPRGKNKEARIRALIGAVFEEGRVFLRASQTEFIDEYLRFPIGSTVDLLDAFAYTSELWQEGLDEGAEQAMLTAERDHRDEVTGY